MTENIKHLKWKATYLNSDNFFGTTSQSFVLFFDTDVWTQDLHPELLHQPFCEEFFFQDRVSRTIGPGWPQTSILLICLLNS
jgi:hypothetical protein